MRGASSSAGAAPLAVCARADDTTRPGEIHGGESMPEQLRERKVRTSRFRCTECAAEQAFYPAGGKLK